MLEMFRPRPEKIHVTRTVLMWTCVMLGLATSAYCMVGIYRDVRPSIRGRSIYYEVDLPIFLWKGSDVATAIVGFSYIIAVHGGFLASSLRYTSVLGLLFLASMAISLEIYREVFASVWCFFAACISFAILYIMLVEITFREESIARIEVDGSVEHDNDGFEMVCCESVAAREPFAENDRPNEVLPVVIDGNNINSDNNAL